MHNGLKFRDASGNMKAVSPTNPLPVSSGGGGGGGGGATTIADGADVAMGARADAAATTDTGTFSLIALVKRLVSKFPASLGPKTGSTSFSVVPASDGFKVEPLGRPSTARVVAAGAANASVALTAGIVRISIYAQGADIRYNLGAAATATSHFIASGERLDIAVTSGTTVQALRNGMTNGELLISELS